MVRPTQIGLLPLYLELYDEVRPEARPDMESFAARVASVLSGLGMEVKSAPVLTRHVAIQREVQRMTDDAALDALATLHLAYSPSLEAVETLVASDRPLLLLDTTPAPSFGVDADAERMFRNHGIHGVQDLSCMLRRRGKSYLLSVGHVDDARFHDDVRLNCRAMRASRAMNTMRVLSIGEAFGGMGDFSVDRHVLSAKLGVQVQHETVDTLAEYAREVNEEQISQEARDDGHRCDCSTVDAKALARTNRLGLAVRRMMAASGAGAVTFNFASFTRNHGVETVPFLEASKVMTRGQGYAGENDVLTAALVGALAQAGCRLTFTEMFCPDWEGNTIFMSHMGECGLDVAESATLVEKTYAFSDLSNPVIAVPKIKPGYATLVNIAPGAHDSFTLIGARVEVLDRGPVAGFPDVPHFWLRPASGDIREFLHAYSNIGGTHHLALCLGDETELVRRMATVMGLTYREI